ncbi:hypothetical protein LCGC14_0446730 [marine sediment metagenome]|uniref:GTP cyclohydrolase I n=1 Tax=marine sediment metagenome TaxID=412755 RepID=A0A0F9T262_9ZZZZ
MHKIDEEGLATAFAEVLRCLGYEKLEGHLEDTPKRAAKAWTHELCRGLNEHGPKVTTFDTDVDEMIVLRHIPIRSMCAHHLLPFLGEATIGYVPGTGKLVGLSKLSRITDWFARRPQVQEELTAQIADYVASLVVDKDPGKEEDKGGPGWRKRARNLGPRGGVGVVIHARHMCMELRGVEHKGDLSTSALRGVFLTKPEARAEFLQLVRTEHPL